MQKTKPEDTPKIIALAAAIIAVFAYVIYSFLRGSAAPAENQANSAAPAPSSNQLMGQPFASSDLSVTPDQGPDAAIQGESLLSNNAMPPTSARDPFQSPIGGAAPDAGQVGSQYDPRNVPSGQPQGGLTSQVGNSDPSTQPMHVEPPPPSELELKGVVSGGSRPMALIRIGNTMLNVYEGQKITKDLVVKKIGVASVEIRNQNDMISLEVGTMLMASIVLPESVVQANPSVSSAPVAGQAVEMPSGNTPVYSAPPQDLQGSAVRAATKAYGPS